MYSRHMYRYPMMFLIQALVAGCNMLPESKPEPQTPEVVVTPVSAEILNERLSASQADVLQAIVSTGNTTDAKVQRIGDAIAAVNKRITSLEAAQKKAAKPSPPLVCPPAPPSELGDKFMLGEVEHVFIDELNASFDTRIDTGAESSSLDARNILLFERDGHDWVRFEVHINGEKKPPSTLEARVVRFVRIKQDSEVDDRRPVIHAHLKIGKYSAETDLNLTDRSHLDYPLLLGRKFIKDIAVVDVSQQFIQGK